MLKGKLDFNCPNCRKDLSPGLARCPNCSEIRPILKPIRKLVSDEFGACAFSGGKSDIRFPNGDWMWAEYVVPLLDRDWAQSDVDYSEELYKRYLEYLEKTRTPSE